MDLMINPEATETTRADRWPVRLGGIALLLTVAYIHLKDLGGKFEEVPYLGVAYLFLIVGCAVAAILLARPTHADHVRGWLLAGGLASLTLLGFVLTRTVGLPRATDDIGNWRETLGVWSMITEALLVLVAGTCLLAPRRDLSTLG